MEHDPLCPLSNWVTVTIGGGGLDSTLAPKVCCCSAIRQAKRDMLAKCIAAVEGVRRAQNCWVDRRGGHIDTDDVIAVLRGLLTERSG